MKKKLFVILAIVMAAAIAGVAFAQTSGSASVGISAGGAGQSYGFAEIQAASSYTPDGVNDPAILKYNAAPSWTPMAGTAGSMIPGDLYHVDANADTFVTIYLDDPNEIVQAYTYLNLKLGIWKDTTGDGVGYDWYGYEGSTWTNAASTEMIDLLSVSGGFVTFSLPAGHYTITIDSGSYYCTDTSSADNLSPEFYVTVVQG